MLVLPQERIHDKWRDTITPPVQIIGSQSARKRKYPDEDVLCRERKQENEILEETRGNMNIVPWYKDLLDKINSSVEAKRVRSDYKDSSTKLKTEMLLEALEPRFLHDYAYARAKHRTEHDDSSRESEKSRINAILSNKISDAGYYDTVDKHLLYRSSARSLHIEQEPRLYDRYKRRSSLNGDDLVLKREVDNFHHPSLHETHYDRRSYTGLFEDNDKRRIADLARPYSTAHSRVTEERDHRSHSEQFCRLCIETARSEDVASLERGQHPLTSSLIRIPAKRLSPVHTPHSPTSPFQNGPVTNDFQKSDRSAFSLFETHLERRPLDGRNVNIKHELHAAYDYNHRLAMERYLMETRPTTSHLQQGTSFQIREGMDKYAAASLEQRKKSYELNSYTKDRIYEDMKYDAYQTMIAQEQRIYGSPDSQRSEDSGFVSSAKDSGSIANEKVTVETQTTARKGKGKSNDCFHLWEFLRDMLNNETMIPKCMEWTNREIGEFRLIKTGLVAKLWGQSKNRTSMTYEKMARAMRYYYKIKILEKVPNKRLHFRFGRHMLPKVLVDYRPAQPMQPCL